MNADTREQLASVLEGQSAVNATMAEVLGIMSAELDARAADVAELRDELHTLAKRLEQLEQLVGTTAERCDARWLRAHPDEPFAPDPAELRHSVKA